MAYTDMTIDEREVFLADLHVGILSVARDGKGPLSLPIWYQYIDGEVTIGIGNSSVKALLLRRHGRATLTVQNETPPYQYVMVEGPVTVEQSDRDVVDMATRYLGPELGAWYAEQNPPSDESALVRLRPENWLTCDYGKSPD
jgi:nitroimidazol reductase NimA-like FMN-containing flavoprotein (pyridoxamine 5'-phosphate oxidase superfamily)